ncbi:MAG: hypothetical protein KKA84_14260 [Bacteroidetes bacterium]|nr:hypothetical protein [Bacteroidota bacterium]
MKRVFIAFVLIYCTSLIAQDRLIDRYSIGINYQQTQLVGGDANIYNLHFEKQIPGSVTFGVDAFLHVGDTRKGTRSIYKSISNFYFGGPTIYYSNAVIGMLYYRASLNAHVGTIKYRDVLQDAQHDVIIEEEGLYYGVFARLEALAMISSNMQFNVGLGFMKGFTTSGDVELNTSSTYQVGINFLL